MTHIVIVSSAIASIRNANAELACRLQAAGHRVTFASPDPAAAAVQAEGIDFLQLGTQVVHPGTSGLAAKAARLVSLVRELPAWRERRDRAVEELGATSCAAELAALAPDLVLVDVELHAHVISALSIGCPVAVLSTWISLDKRRGLPPLHRYIVPGRGRSGSALAIEWAWWRYRAWKAANALQQFIRTAGVPPISVLRRHAQLVGVDFGLHVDRWQWLVPFSYRGVPVVSLNAPELDFPHRAQPGVHHVGPMVRPQRTETAAAEADPELDRLLASHAEPNDSVSWEHVRPLIYCSFGAFYTGDDSALLGAVVDAVRERPTWDVIIGLGGRLDPAALGPLPPHVLVRSWVPQLRVLRCADAAVVHGGISTINECLWWGVPMLSYPIPKVTDQLGNAARISYHGVGIVGQRSVASAADIRMYLDRLLDDPSYRVAAQSMGVALRASATDHRAEAVVAAMLP